jgi:hypothetical protein
MTNCLMNRPSPVRPDSSRYLGTYSTIVRRASGPRKSRIDSCITPVVTAANRGATSDWRLFHDDKPRPLQVLHQALGDDRRHHLAGVVRPLAAAVAQREGERIGEVFRGGGREAIGVRHELRIIAAEGTRQERRWDRSPLPRFRDR